MTPLPPNLEGRAEAFALGLSTTATHFIWLVTVLGLASMAFDAAMDTGAALHEARLAREPIDRELQRTLFGNATFCWVPSQTVVRATYDAGPALNSSAVTLVVDGVVATGFASNRSATALWLPNETLYFNKSGVTTVPEKVVLYTERGVMVHLPQVTCTVDVYVAAMQTYENGVATSTFDKRDVVETRVTVRQTNGSLVQGAIVAIEIRDKDNVVQFTGTGATNATGVASISYTLPASAAKGTWTDRVTNVGGTSVTYVPSSNVVTQVTFSVN
ncbi:MAG TPA: hypothetical protein VHH36_01965 [Candidatus Thermoplasmatota archaeon]|nr:hypothetical protein [Candidatus Thermoplasmatota archaeon]